MPINQSSFAEQLNQRRAALLQLQQQRQQQRRLPRRELVTVDPTLEESTTTTTTTTTFAPPVTDRESPVDQTMARDEPASSIPSTSASSSVRGIAVKPSSKPAVSIQQPVIVSAPVPQLAMAVPKAAGTGRDRPAGAPMAAAAGSGRPRARGQRPEDSGAAARRALAATLESSVRELRAMTETLSKSDHVWNMLWSQSRLYLSGL